MSFCDRSHNQRIPYHRTQHEQNGIGFIPGCFFQILRKVCDLGFFRSLYPEELLQRYPFEPIQF